MGLFGHKNRYDPNQPRQHHYAFAHRVLPQTLFSDPTFLVRAGREQRLLELWERSADVASKAIRDADLPEKFKAGLDITRCSPDGLNCVLVDVGDRGGALVEMPATLRPTEAVLAVVVHGPSTGPGIDSSSRGIRYFTLERGKTVDGVPQTYLCEWTHGGRRHENYGEAGPLLEAIEDARIGLTDRQKLRKVFRVALLETLDELLRSGTLDASTGSPASTR